MSRPHRFSRRVILNPMAVAMQGASKLPAEDQLRMDAMLQQAFELFRAGQDCAAQWNKMVDALNVAESLAGLGICSDVDSRDRIASAQAALSIGYLRHAERGTWALRALELQALEDGLWTHRVQLQHCTHSEYSAAHTATVRRISQALRGNAPPGATIIGQTLN